MTHRIAIVTSTDDVKSRVDLTLESFGRIDVRGADSDGPCGDL
jgi:hypothetical protein